MRWINGPSFIFFFFSIISAVFCQLPPNHPSIFNHDDVMYRSGCPFAKRQKTCGNTANNMYPKIDGTCNNPVREEIGSSLSTLKRLLPAEYADGIKAVKTKGLDGSELPSARLISNKLQDAELSDSSETFSHMFVQFGQFLTHDIVDTPKALDEEGVGLECDCNSKNPECIKIPIPENDPVYTPEVKCIAMVRSRVAPGSGCGMKPREHLNTITSFIDGTTVYGSSDQLVSALRNVSTAEGLMAVTASPNGDKRMDKLPYRRNLQPSIQAMLDCPKHLNEENSCYAGGEHRLNENIGLSTTHTVFMREHNRIATELKNLNPNWSAERIFQESRRIISSISQIVTYKEFLPALVGEKYMKEFSLSLLTSGYYYGYDASYDASISNAFTTAAFRYGHSMINENFMFLDSEYQRTSPNVEMHKTLFQPELILDFVHNNDAKLMRGLIEDVAKNVDNNFVEEMRSKMFLSATKHGRDLFAINIQRGRDHGLPGYNKYREFCGLNGASTFHDLKYEIPVKTRNLLADIYKSVEDIDLFVGGLSETPLEGAAVGPTFACIIAYQFRDLRKGDRFWHENPDMFSEAQLQELRKSSLSRVMCDNIVDMETIQPNTMLLKTVEGNSRVSCDQIPAINLQAWREKPHTVFNKDNMDWTRWFMKTEPDNVKLLASLREHYTDDVCSSPLDYQEETYRGKLTGKQHKRIRFLCPSGTVADANFPKMPEGCEWTKWYDRDSPLIHNGDDKEIFSYTKLENPNEICDHPIAMQARTVKGDLLDENQTFHELHPLRGLYCKEDEQVEGVKCFDYKVRYLCSSEFFTKHHYQQKEEANKPTTTWTEWINLGPPNSYGERETLFDAINKGYNVCRRPLQINYRIANSNHYGHQVLKRVSPLVGLICVHYDQEMGKCYDYEVRYLCATHLYKSKKNYV